MRIERNLWAIKAPGLSYYCLHCTLVSPKVPIGYSHSPGSSKAGDRCLLHLADTPGKCCGRPGAGQSKGKTDLGGSKGQVGRRGARPLSPWLVQVTPRHQLHALLPSPPLLLSPSQPRRGRTKDGLAPVSWTLLRLLPDSPRAFTPQIL